MKTMEISPPTELCFEDFQIGQPTEDTAPNGIITFIYERISLSLFDHYSRDFLGAEDQFPHSVLFSISQNSISID
jgi:hypothetical protein